MNKTLIPTKAPSVWATIARLRINRIDALAPKMQDRVNAMLADAKKIASVDGERFDPIVFETARVDELQRIYYRQGTTKAYSAIYGWHFYGLAVDFISKSQEWSVSGAWWETLAKLMEKHGIDPGRRWKHPDDPHGQFGTLKPSPSDLSRTLYFGTPHWAGLETFTDERHEQGLRRVWKAVGAV